MDNFNLRAFLSNNPLNENMDVEVTAKVAQKIADAFSTDDDLDLKYVVNPRIDAGHFDLDVEAGPNTPGEDSLGQDIDNYLGEFAGGSFYIKDGVVYNAAMRNAPVANVTPEGEVEMISAEDSRAAIGMEDDERNPGMYIDDEEWEREMGRMEENKEETKSNKMKKSELKEMIKAAMLAEMEVEETEVFEAEEEEDVEVAVSDEEEMDIEEPAEDEGEVEVEDNAKTELTGDKKDVSDNLEAALEAARALGDEKLVDQIGNTITFFTRAHIVKEDELQDEAEEMLQESLRMKRLAGLIK